MKNQIVTWGLNFEDTKTTAEIKHNFRSCTGVNPPHFVRTRSAIRKINRALAVQMRGKV